MNIINLITASDHTHAAPCAANVSI